PSTVSGICATPATVKPSSERLPLLRRSLWHPAQVRLTTSSSASGATTGARRGASGCTLASARRCTAVVSTWGAALALGVPATSSAVASGEGAGARSRTRSASATWAASADTNTANAAVDTTVFIPGLLFRQRVCYPERLLLPSPRCTARRGLHRSLLVYRWEI